MDALLLARLQFGVTTVYHFFFVPLTLGSLDHGGAHGNAVCAHRYRKSINR